MLLENFEGRKAVTAEIFDQGIGLLIATFRDLKVSKEQIKTWRILLSEIEDEPFMNGILRVCKNHEQIFQGTNIVALIRREVILSDDGLQTAEEAWREVQEQIISVGCDRNPDLCQLAQSVVETIGWKNLCFSNVHDLIMQRAHFFRIYEAFKKLDDDENLNADVRYLTGMIQKQQKQLPNPKK